MSHEVNETCGCGATLRTVVTSTSGGSDYRHSAAERFDKVVADFRRDHSCSSRRPLSFSELGVQTMAARGDGEQNG